MVITLLRSNEGMTEDERNTKAKYRGDKSTTPLNTNPLLSMSS
jgi:hypothetical protein